MFSKVVSLFLILFVASMATISAQGVDPGPPPGSIPIDGGVGFLLAAGAAYGLKKIRDYKAKQE
jgi:hypothetical protein